MSAYKRGTVAMVTPEAPAPKNASRRAMLTAGGRWYQESGVTPTPVLNCSRCDNDVDEDAARLGEDHRDAWVVIEGLPVCCDCKDDMLSDPWPGERDD